MFCFRINKLAEDFECAVTAHTPSPARALANTCISKYHAAGPQFGQDH
jgi:hypothetical protein